MPSLRCLCRGPGSVGEQYSLVTTSQSNYKHLGFTNVLCIPGALAQNVLFYRAFSSLQVVELLSCLGVFFTVFFNQPAHAVPCCAPPTKGTCTTGTINTCQRKLPATCRQAQLPHRLAAGPPPCRPRRLSNKAQMLKCSVATTPYVHRVQTISKAVRMRRRRSCSRACAGVCMYLAPHQISCKGHVVVRRTGSQNLGMLLSHDNNMDTVAHTASQAEAIKFSQETKHVRLRRKAVDCK